MKQLMMSILFCAGVAVSMLAGEPLGASPQQLGMAQVDNSDVMVTSEGVSIQRLMREHGFTPNDNRLARKLPRRLSMDDMTGNRIAVMEVFGGQDPENMSWVANLMAGDSNQQVKVENFCTIDINAVADSAGYEEEIFFNSDGLIPINLPIQFDWDAGTVLLQCDEPIYHDEVVEADPGNDKFKNKKVTDVFIVPVETEMIGGGLYSDGSIIIDGAFMLTTRLVYKSWKGSIVEQDYYDYDIDTVYVESPVFSNLYLMMPNGTHEYKVANMLNPGGESGNLVHRVFDIQRVTLPWDSHGLPNEDMGVGGRKPVRPGSGPGDTSGHGIGHGTGIDGADGHVSFLNSSSNGDSGIPNTVGTSGHKSDLIIHEGASDNDVADIKGVGGRKPSKPGKPGRTTDDLGEKTQTEPVDSPTETTLAHNNNGMGMKKMIVQSPGHPKNELVNNSPDADQQIGDNGDAVGVGGNGNGYMMSSNTGDYTELHTVPVYVFQTDDDGLVYMCNLYGNSLINYMIVNNDSTMTFPLQLIGKDVYNYEGIKSPGCTGMAVAGIIYWEKTFPVSIKGRVPSYPSRYFVDNYLTFDEGVPFMHAPVVGITAVTRKINDALNGDGNVTEVIDLINEMLNSKE